MIRVEIYKDDQLVLSSPFTDDSFTIGRSNECDISLPDIRVSRVHLLIQRKNQNYSVIDKSRNGIKLKGLSVTSGEIQLTDEIELGPWTIKLQNSSVDVEITENEVRKDPTCILSYHEENKELSLMKVSLIQRSPIERNFPFHKNLMTLGKNPSNDVIITDDYVSQFHCKIEFRAGNFWIKDLQSTNGTHLNGMKMMEALLPHQSVIGIGKAEFEFQLHEKKEKITPSNQNEFYGMISTNEKMKDIFGLIQSIKSISSPVLIQGETGTGKELVAKAIHHTSSHGRGPFVAVNCGAIPKDLIESELFGHEKGSFTGALLQREGLFEQAHGGTLFLDEIGELPLHLQSKLLRVLETGEVRRVGASKNIHVDVRIIAATHRNLYEEVQKKRFREDLFYRIYVLPITLPALRNRMEDIPHLVRHFLRNHRTNPENVTAPVFDKLRRHSWPGNIRELKNVVDRALSIILDKKEIGPEHIQFANFVELQPPQISPMPLEDMEKMNIHAMLEKNRWNKKVTAEKLGIAKSTLHEKLRKFGMQKPLNLGK